MIPVVDLEGWKVIATLIAITLAVALAALAAGVHPTEPDLGSSSPPRRVLGRSGAPLEERSQAVRSVPTPAHLHSRRNGDRGGLSITPRRKPKSRARQRPRGA